MHDDPLRDARVAVQAGRFREAWQKLSDAGEAVRRAPEWLLLAAVTHFRLGEFARCRAAAFQARDGFRAQGDVDGEMRAENAAAVGGFALGDLSEAEEGFQRALALAHHLKDEFMGARCANNLGNVAYYLAQYEKALGFYRLATATFEKLALYNELALNCFNSAIVWREQGNLKESQDAADRAITAAERAGDQRFLAQALSAGAETSVALGDVALARAQVTRALELSRTHDDPLGEADALRILSVVERLDGELDRAEENAHRGLSLARQLQHLWAEAELQRDLAAIYAAQRRGEDASVAFHQAANGFRRLGSVTRAEEMRARAADAAKRS